MLRACILLLSLAMTSPVAASDVGGRSAIEGPGRIKCADLPREGQAHRDLAAWVAGYVSASNRHLPETFDLTPWQPPEVLISQMAQFCARFPKRSAAAAMEALLEHLHPTRMIEAEQPVAFVANGRTVAIYPSTLEQVRQQLASKGHPPGQTPEETAAAISAFQSELGIEVTGLPDTRTIARLLIGP